MTFLFYLTFFQLEPEKKHKVDFETRKLQRVRIRSEKLAMRQTLERELFRLIRFRIKNFTTRPIFN